VIRNPWDVDIEDWWGKETVAMMSTCSEPLVSRSESAERSREDCSPKSCPKEDSLSLVIKLSDIQKPH
jgi:hypothetical protein